MRTEDLDRLVREALEAEGRRARLDVSRWAPDLRHGSPRRRAAATPAVRRTATVLVAAAVVAAGIAIPLALLSDLRRDGRDTVTVPQSPEDLWGRTFLSTSVTEGGAPRRLVEGTRIRVEFERRGEGGVVRWDAGCNTHGADADITAERIRAGEAASTQIGCPEDLLEQDSWLHLFMTSDPMWRLEGDRLTLASHETVIELEARGDTAEPSAAPATHADADDGISITIPSDWTFHQDPSDPTGRIRTLFAVGSWAFTEGGECVPSAALEELPPNGVLVWINEDDPELSAIDAVPRPERFDLDEAPFVQPDCSPVPLQYQWFAENDRYMQVNVAYGEDASDAVRAETLHALDSMVLTAPVPDGCPRDVGPWSDPDCPEQAWVRAIVEAAGHEVTGDTGSAFVLDAGGIRLYIHTTNASGPVVERGVEGYERAYPSIDYYPVLSDGTRTVWQVDAFNVWITEYDVDVPAEVVDRLVAASLRVDYDAIDTR